MYLSIYANNFPVPWYLYYYSYQLYILIAPLIHHFLQLVINCTSFEKIDTRYWYRIYALRYETQSITFRNIVSHNFNFNEICINIFWMNTHKMNWGELYADPFHTPYIRDEKVKSFTHNRIVEMHIFLSFSCVLSLKARYFC